jgi:hypothetical protein
MFDEDTRHPRVVLMWNRLPQRGQRNHQTRVAQMDHAIAHAIAA